ncbi:hypothetical protein PUN28_009270 [Cardiocondyla obscurior]|uniref:Secreted protein n=1 Tax=Cardiocondyla obscurior TaxID=286306 RepID=A0AAW2FSN9_9HYME
MKIRFLSIFLFTIGLRERDRFVTRDDSPSVLALLYRDAWAPRASNAFATTSSTTTTTTTTTTTSTAIRIADLTLRPPSAHPPKHQENYRRRATLVILRRMPGENKTFLGTLPHRPPTVQP